MNPTESRANTDASRDNISQSKPERFGIYGGTFSPVHRGHMQAAKAFFDELSLDRLLLIPTAEPPHKAAVAGATAEERLEMVRLAVGELVGGYSEAVNIEASDFEVKREGKSFTVYTLEHFARSGRELFLLVGTDMFLTLDRWYRAGDIFNLAHIALMRRESEPELGARIETKKSEYISKFGAKITELAGEHIELSSTELRALLDAGADVTRLVPESVELYIRERGLYAN